MKTSLALMLVATLAFAAALNMKQVLGPAAALHTVKGSIKTFSSRASPRLGQADPPAEEEEEDDPPA